VSGISSACVKGSQGTSTSCVLNPLMCSVMLLTSELNGTTDSAVDTGNSFSSANAWKTAIKGSVCKSKSMAEDFMMSNGRSASSEAECTKMCLALVSGALSGITFHLRVRRWRLKQLCDHQYAWQVFELVKNHQETTLHNSIFVVFDAMLTIACTALIVHAVMNNHRQWPG